MPVYIMVVPCTSGPTGDFILQWATTVWELTRKIMERSSGKYCESIRSRKIPMGRILTQPSRLIIHSTKRLQGKTALSTSLACAIPSLLISSRALDECLSMTWARRFASASLRELKEEIVAGPYLSVRQIRQSLG